jgi:hypothetical protein
MANGQRLLAKAQKDTRELHQLIAARKEAEEKWRRPTDQNQQGCPTSLESWLHADVPQRQNADIATTAALLNSIRSTCRVVFKAEPFYQGDAGIPRSGRARHPSPDQPP